ncbi:MAG: sulfatase-like hydrolase/transferase [Bryobacteraceae bacterium]
MNRRRFLSTPLAASASGAVPSGAASRPNVIIFFTDQQRWDSIGAYGNPMGITPNLDRMAAEGVRFHHAFTSQPVCGPARSTLQTGKYPTATGVIRNGPVLRDGETTLAQQFGAAGYRTGYIGKWHLGGTVREPVPLERRGGYDQYWMSSDVLEFTSTPYEGTVFDRDGKPVRWDGQYRVDFLTDHAIDFVRKNRQSPFFLCISYLEPHHQNSTQTFIGPKGYADRFRNDFWIPPDLVPYPGDWKSQLPDYYGIIARIDECFGRLMQELRDQQLDKNTIVAMVTDHSCHFRTRNREYKRSCHDASIRIPLMIQGPGFEPGRVVWDLVSLADLPPTLCDASGIRPPAGMQGRSMMPLARGNREGWPREVIVQMREEALQRAIRTDQFKYCIFDPQSKPNEPHSTRYTERFLYDLRSDPHEHFNLIGRPQYRKIAEELGQRLARRMAALGEPAFETQKTRFYA